MAWRMAEIDAKMAAQSNWHNAQSVDRAALPEHLAALNIQLAELQHMFLQASTKAQKRALKKQCKELDARIGTEHACYRESINLAACMSPLSSVFEVDIPQAPTLEMPSGGGDIEVAVPKEPTGGGDMEVAAPKEPSLPKGIRKGLQPNQRNDAAPKEPCQNALVTIGL